LGLLTCKNRLPYNLYCVGGDVKHCSLTHSLTQSPRSLILVPIERAHMTSYWSSIVTLVLSCRVSEISAFLNPSPVPAKFQGGPLGEGPGCRNLRRAKTPTLTNGENIFEEFQPMWSRYLNVTDRRTDGQFAVAIPRSA